MSVRATVVAAAVAAVASGRMASRRGYGRAEVRPGAQDAATPSWGDARGRGVLGARQLAELRGATAPNLTSIVSVLDYGAVGDGSFDNTAAFQVGAGASGW